MVKRSKMKRKGEAIYSTHVLKDAMDASKKLGKMFYVRPRWFGGYSVFKRK